MKATCLHFPLHRNSSCASLAEADWPLHYLGPISVSSRGSRSLPHHSPLTGDRLSPHRMPARTSLSLGLQSCTCFKIRTLCRNLGHIKVTSPFLRVFCVKDTSSVLKQNNTQSCPVQPVWGPTSKGKRALVCQWSCLLSSVVSLMSFAYI